MTGTTTTAACEPWAVNSSTVTVLADHLRRHAEGLDDVCSRMTGVANLDWDSPAGRNFREYLTFRKNGVLEAAELLRAAAARVEIFAQTLRGVEYARFLQHPP